MKKRAMKKNSYQPNNKMNYNCNGASGWIYFLGIIGAAIYYIQQSSTFWQGVLGVLKAIVWPAFLVYKLLGF